MGVLRIIGLGMKLEMVSRANPEKVAEIQERRFRSLLRYAAEYSRFYRERFRGIDPKTCKITDLPPVTKQEMMANFDDLVTDRRLKRAEIYEWLMDKENYGKMYKGKFIPFQTSGTTGENSIMVYDRRGFDYAYATLITRNAVSEKFSLWDRFKLSLRIALTRKIRLATVIMTGVAYPSNTVALHTPRLHHLFFKHRIFSLTAPIDQTVERLNAFQPDAMVVYPSLMETLAREQIAGRLRLNFTSPTSMIVSGGETLSPTAKKLAKKAWNIDIQNAYGAAECLPMANSCLSFDLLHVMNDLCILEVVDRKNNPVSDGETGEKVLITNLFNRIQPIIRYELNDVTGYSTHKCDCGWPFPTLLPVQGRTVDIFYINRLEGGYEPFHPYIILGPVGELDEIREYQIVQTDRNKAVFSYVPVDSSTAIDDKVRKIVEKCLGEAGFLGRIRIDIKAVDSIPRDERSGKFRFVISLVGPPDDLDS